MFGHTLLVSLLVNLASSSLVPHGPWNPVGDSHSIPSKLNITAITAVNGISVLQCWQLAGNLAASTGSGTAGAATLSLGEITNITYTVLPAQFDGGLHNAPYVQWVAFTSGLAHLTLPNSTDEAWVKGGKHGLIIAADIKAFNSTGHITVYPSDETTYVPAPR